jgi:hypothetical protein
MEQTQASAPGQPQAQAPVHPVHEETATVEALTKWVGENPDNDPHAGTDLEAPPQEQKVEEKTEEKTEEKAEEAETIEIDDEAPLFEVQDPDDKTKTVKVSLKQLREERMMKADYHRNIQRVKQQEAEIQEKVKQASLQAQGDYLKQLETHKQLVLKTVAPELQNVDLNKLAQEDPAEAQRLFFRQIQLTQTLQAIETEQRQAQEKLQKDQEAALSQAVEKSRQTLEADIQGWNSDVYQKVLGSVAKDYGFDKKDVESVYDARLIKVFHDAYQYRQLQRAKPEVSKRVVAVPKVVKPGSAEKPSPRSDADDAFNRLKKSGSLDDAANWYLQKQKGNKR